MQNTLNEFTKLHLKALNESSYYALIKDDINYERKFVDARSLLEVVQFFGDGKLPIDDIIGFYLLYHHSLTSDDQNVLAQVKGTTDIQALGKVVVDSLEHVKALKREGSRIGSTINMILTLLESYEPVQYEETEINEIENYSFTHADGRPVHESDSLYIFNNLKTNNRYPVILYCNPVGKIIARLNNNCSVSFAPEHLLRNEFPNNSITVCNEIGDFVIFDFEKSSCSIKIKSTGNDDRFQKISNFMNMLAFSKESGSKKIVGTISFFVNKTIDYFSLYRFFITNEIASTLFYVDETAKPWCSKDKFYVFFRDFGPEMINSEDIRTAENYLRISIPTQKKDNKTSGFSVQFTTKSKDMINSFLYKTSRLLSLFNTSSQRTASTKHAIQSTHTKIYIKPINRLNEKAGELFKHEKKGRGETSTIQPGDYYCRKCMAGKQPIIVEEDEVPEWVAYGREPKLFPPEDWGFEKRYWIVCPFEANPIIKLIPNPQDTTGKVSELPCCISQEENAKKPDDVIVRITTRPGITDAPNNINSIGKINDTLADFLERSITGDESSTIVFSKMGTCILDDEASVFNSFITAILLATGMVVDPANPPMFNTKNDFQRNADIVRARMAELPPDVYKQELYDMSDVEIIESILDPKTFIDPFLYYRGLEIIFGVQIFVFSSQKGRKTPFSDKENLLSIPTLEVPRCKYMHNRNNNGNNIVCIYKNYGNSPQKLSVIPTCELIVYSHGNDLRNYNKLVNSSNVGYFNSLFDLMSKVCHPLEWKDDHTKRIETTCLDDPYNTVDWTRYDFGELGPIMGQEIDTYGKCSALLFKDWTLIIPPVQPLPILSRSQRVIKLSDGREHRVYNGGTKRRAPLRSISEALEKFADSTEDVDGIWIKFNGIDKGLKVPCISKITPGNHAFTDVMTIIERKNKVSILMQIINWLWRSDWNGTSFPVFTEWWREHAIIDNGDIFNDVPNTLYNCNNMMLPVLSSFDERINAAARIWPFFFYKGKIHVSPKLYMKIENCFNIEDIYSRGFTPNDIYGEPGRFIVGLIPTDSDYKRNDDLILTDPEHIKDWISRNVSSIFKFKSLHNVNIIRDSILPNYKFYLEPYLYKDKDGKIYLIQNSTRKTSPPEEAALQIAHFWKTHQINPGYAYHNENNSELLENVRYIEYRNKFNAMAKYKNTTEGSTDYLEIYCYDDMQTYAAMLPIL